MTQTRTFLLIAWLVVAYFLWDAWQRDYLQPQPPITAPDTIAAPMDAGSAAIP